MATKSQKALSAVAVLLVFSVLQVYVQAGLKGQTPVISNAAANAAQGRIVFGKLTTVDNRSIVVNGNNVLPGATIISGAQLQTSNEAGAQVSLGKLGGLDIALDTDLTLAFSEERVEVNLAKGCVVLTTSAGTTGIVKTPQGKVVTSGPEKRAFSSTDRNELKAVTSTIGQDTATNSDAKTNAANTIMASSDGQSSAQRGTKVETVDLGDVTGTVCDCGEIPIPPAGRRGLPFLALGGFPFWLFGGGGGAIAAIVPFVGGRGEEISNSPGNERPATISAMTP